MRIGFANASVASFASDTDIMLMISPEGVRRGGKLIDPARPEEVSEEGVGDADGVLTVDGVCFLTAGASVCGGDGDGMSLGIAPSALAAPAPSVIAATT